MVTVTKAELAPQEVNRNCMKEPTRAIQYLIDTAPLYSRAKADRIYLDEFRKSRRAQLMSQAGTEVLGKQETFAYAHPDYIQILEGIREAVET